MNNSAVFSYDTATVGPPIELAPQTGSNRRAPAIGGPTVVWQDFGLASTPQIAVYDRGTAQMTPLTNDAGFHQEPGVSPAGDVLVWTRGESVNGDCHIWQATGGGRPGLRRH